MYTVNDNYNYNVQESQSVPSVEKVKQWHPEIEDADILTTRIDAGAYSCHDNFQMASIQDDHIYIATTEGQHNRIVNGEIMEKSGLGYFSDQATVDRCVNADGTLDNGKYNDMCQIAPYADDNGEFNYKPHLDQFEINRDALEAHYGTRDFNAAIGKCEKK